MNKGIVNGAVIIVSGALFSFAVPFGATSGYLLAKKMFGENHHYEKYVSAELQNKKFDKDTALDFQKKEKKNKTMQNMVSSDDPKVNEALTTEALKAMSLTLDDTIKSTEERTESLKKIANQMLNKTRELETSEYEKQGKTNPNPEIYFRSKEEGGGVRVGDEIVSSKSIKGVVQHNEPPQASPDKPLVKPRLGYDGQGNRLNREGLKEQVKAIAEKLPKDFTINFEAQGEERGQLFVFTDPTCPYCRKLDNDIDKLTAQGFTVRYLMFPKAGYQNNPVVDRMLSAWCSVDQAKAMSDIYKGKRFGDNDCSVLTEQQKKYGDIVVQHFMLGQFFEVSGTPTVFSTNGGLSAGYSNPSKLFRALGY